MGENTQPHFSKIDVLRGTAIICVFICHAQDIFYPGYKVTTYNTGHRLSINTAKQAILNFSPPAFGWTGVELFFIISGFLIHYAFLWSSKELNRKLFFSKRFWRIYPPYLLALLFFFIYHNGIHYFLNPVGVKDFLLHFFLIHNYTDDNFFSINSSFWSLAVEAQLYLLYPVFLYIRRKLGYKKAVVCTVAVSLVAVMIGIYTNNLGGSIAYYNSVFKFWFVWCTGALLAESYFNGKKLFTGNVKLWVFFGFIALFISKYFSFSNYFILYFATIAWLAFFEWFLFLEKFNPSNLLSRSLILIGLCSYSIYLLHQPLLYFIIPRLSFLTSANAHLVTLQVIPAFLLILLISYLMYLFVEMPSIRFGNKLRNKN